MGNIISITLSQNKVAEVDVLSGAFFMIRKKIIDQIGLLDERFFMYGEDIDLSYRIQTNGYKNYYVPTTSIIHYKGESTKKTSVNYIITFYKAMILFVKKHYNNKNAKIFNIFDTTSHIIQSIDINNKKNHFKSYISNN